MALAWQRVHLIAAAEASRAHRDLRIDVSRRIDPFVALAAAGVPAMRRRLDHVSGIYLPADPHERSAPGVIVNIAHPPSRQRFTAAHELGHHRRDGQLAIDLETEWMARGEERDSDIERIAEAFAAWFLMPKRLVEAMLARLGLRADRLDAEAAYALSLELGTSYTATIHHLANLRLIGEAARRHLAAITPQTIKRDLGGQTAIADARRDVWLVRPSQARHDLEAMVGDVIIVELPEIPSSGYLWQPAAVPPGIALVRDEFLAPIADALGGGGQHRFLFRVDGGDRQLRLEVEMRRPWQRVVAEALQVEIVVRPIPKPGIVEPGLLIPAAA